MNYEVGQKLRFIGEPHPDTGALRHLGADGEVHSLAGAPDGNHPLPIGSIGTVLVGHDLTDETHPDGPGHQKPDSPIVPAHITGAGSETEDCIILAFVTKSAYVDENGEAALLLGSRNISFTVEQLDEWFVSVVDAATAPVEVA